MPPVDFLRKALYHDICRHFRCCEVDCVNSIVFAGISNKMVSYPNVLGSLMELWILCEFNSTLVVDKDFLTIGIQPK